MSLRASVTALAALVSLVLFPSLAAAQGLEVRIRDGFGAEGSSFVLVDVINRASREIHGHVELSIDENSGGQRFRLGADIPPRDRRTLQFETGMPQGYLKARLVENGRVIGEGETWRGGGGNLIVFLADPPRLQASAAGLTGSREMPYGPEAFDYVTGTVDFDAAGDPVAPRRLQGWRGVDILVAAVAELERLDSAQLQALRKHVFGGGRVLISPSAPEEVRAASVQSLLGEVRVLEDRLTSADPLWQSEYFGGGRPHGFGYVWILTKDINAPSSVGSSRVTTLLANIVARSATVGPQLPLYSEESLNRWDAHASFRDLRSALDPNASFKPALGLVAVLLLLYVLAVGPLNFSFVQKRGKPTLALITTPILSFGCLVLMLLVGFIGKGVTMRHRSITWVESLAGESQGLRRTYRGLYSTRPATFDVEANGVVAYAGQPTSMLTHTIGPSGEETLTDIRASLWSTTLLREVDVVPFGRVDFALVEGELQSVTNHGEETLLAALIVGSGGRVFEIGDVLPGQTVPLSATPSYFASTGGEEGLARSLGFPEDAYEIVGGQLRLVGVMTTTSPTLFARVDRSDGTIALFAEETSSTLLSVQVPAQELPIVNGDPNHWRFGDGPALGPESSPQRVPESDIGEGIDMEGLEQLMQEASP